MGVDEGCFADEGLVAHAPKGAEDRGLAWFLALGVLRNRSHVDASLRAHLRQPIGSLDSGVRATLRVGAFEKLYARTPPHAVVNEAVEVCKVIGKGHARGLVNAVLRKVAEPQGLSEAQQHDQPAWLWERWKGRYGAEAASKWAKQNHETPPLVLVAADPSFDPSCLAESDRQVEPVHLRGAVIHGAFRVKGHKGPVDPLLDHPSGSCWVQDAAAIAVADFGCVTPGQRVLDACAAPGGKSFRMASQGAQVVAVDRAEERLDLVREGALRLGFKMDCQLHTWGEDPWEGPCDFDLVLVDAPCSGLGTVGRHPEIRWLRAPEDLAFCAARQQAILESASAALKSGGHLVYAVCSGEPEEGDAVVRAFTESNPRFELLETWTSAPPEGVEDGHFVAKWSLGA
jgi:16S rRNA (cytosine967-C5)-methyltransferase